MENSNFTAVLLSAAPQLIFSNRRPLRETFAKGKVFTESIKTNPPKDTMVDVFCRSGGRVSVVKWGLKERGYIIDGLEGGLDNYENS